ncbi:DUF5681 domain-containing protein [Sphingomonas prati]|uniref:DUF5681 domain-containing protein n=1 Tax=Sphingomonas prati TaxID=1843237 RepID=A0A7W9F2P0_9SPHN|nr:DUF5681 domain-containing protein [Sphingomonas prati]MBB5730593.1 hypothetical protein [Sphingomonas prati]GGE95205.1 hypothetical protein GCM10011404_30430 [Sphingomonas prati]
MSDSNDGQVGYCRPPIHSRFQKGGVGGNRPGRRKAETLDMAAILDEDVSVTEGGRKRRKPAFEVEFSNLMTKAIKGDISACRQVTKHLNDAGILKPPADAHQYVLRIPLHWKDEDWKAMYDLHGPPPWDGPDDGLIPEYRRPNHWSEE